MEIPSDGKYLCKLNDPMVIYEASTGSLCAAIPCVMQSPPAHVGFTFKHTMVLVKADGTVQTKTMDTLKEVFGWSGEDPFWFMDESQEGCSLRDISFEIVGGPETGDKGGQYFKSQWLNPVGGGLKKPEAANRQSVLAKYGTKFKALASVSAPAGKSSAPTAPPVPKAPPVRKAAPSGPPQGATMDEAWAALNAANPGKAPAVVETLWFDTISKLFPNKSNTDLKLHEWALLKAEFEKDELPM